MQNLLIYALILYTVFISFKLLYVTQINYVIKFLRFQWRMKVNIALRLSLKIFNPATCSVRVAWHVFVRSQVVTLGSYGKGCKSLNIFSVMDTKHTFTRFWFLVFNSNLKKFVGGSLNLRANPRAGAYFAQQSSIFNRRGNAASLLGALLFVSDFVHRHCYYFSLFWNFYFLIIIFNY